MNFISWKHIILDLGSGWAPAVLEYEEEHSFIRKHLREMDDSQYYFIGGSTSHTSLDALEYSNYITTRSGKYTSISHILH